MKVVYVVAVEIEVPDTRQRHMAVFEASKQWPEIEHAITAIANRVTVKSIQVEGQKRQKGDDASE